MAFHRITEDIFVAHTVCERKSYLLMYEYGEVQIQPYAALLSERKQKNEIDYFQSKLGCVDYRSDKLSGEAKYVLNAELNTETASVVNVHLKKIDSVSNLGIFSYEPIIFSEWSAISSTDKRKALYIAHILHEIQGKMPERAYIVLANGSTHNIKISNEYKLPVLNELLEWVNSKPEAPAITFKNHCSICQFERRCLATAEHTDSLSLLSGMPATVRRKYESKGIFTVSQLSYLYKPRRRSKKLAKRKPIHQYELQALALRTNNIYTNDLLGITEHDVEIYIDIESVPDQQFHYLIGVLVSRPSSQTYFPFWASTRDEQRAIWTSFLEIVNLHQTAPIFHYGSYERKVIIELSKRYNTNIDSILHRLDNVNSYIYGRIYFPTRSNRLKDICSYLGFVWTNKNLNGLNSIVWRHHFDTSNDPIYRSDLIQYNQEDCVNLQKLKLVVAEICSQDVLKPGVKAANDNEQLLTSTGKNLLDEFSSIIKSAHGKYEKSKISLRRKQSTNSSRSKHPHNIPSPKVTRVIRVPRGRICPVHHRPLSPTDSIKESIITDLELGPRGIKSIRTKYWGYKGRCPNCSDRHIPPGLRKFGKNAKYGRGLKSWIAYHRLTMRLPLQKITQLLEDTFNIRIASGGIDNLFRSICSEYRTTEKRILKEMMLSQAIHVDETLVNIQGATQYVWVFTDGKNVIFRLTATRDSSIAHQILSGFKGVVISDFFAGYDALECSQQKCWVHLIRDINDELRKAPFDADLESFVSSLRDLLVPIFDAIEKYGLKKCHLIKFKRSVETFYSLHIDGCKYKSDITQRYIKRLSRYRTSLFVFLEHDNIPWNNNMAERALRHLAVQRKISGSFFETGMTEYLVLLGIMQTCRFQNKSFLAFLMSGNKDINFIKAKTNSIGWSMD